MTKTIGEKTGGETWLDSLDPATSPARDGRHLREIGRALTALEQAEIDLRASVEAARAASDFWEANWPRPRRLPTGGAPQVRAPDLTAPGPRRSRRLPSAASATSITWRQLCDVHPSSGGHGGSSGIGTSCRTCNRLGPSATSRTLTDGIGTELSTRLSAQPLPSVAPSQMAIHGDDNHAGRYFEECVVALEAEGIHDIDLVLCAGDITDRAEPECISAGQRVAPRPRSNS